MKNSLLLCLAFLLGMPAICQADIVFTWDFDTAGDFEGWSGSSQVSGFAVSGGLITGTAVGGNDPQLNNTGLSLTTDPSGAEWTTLTFSYRETDEGSNVVPFNPTGIVVAINGGGAGGLLVTSGFSFTSLGNGFTEVSADISGFSSASTITSLRVDPIGGAASNSNSETNGNFFEVDYIRVSDSLSAIPEPTSFAMLSAFGLGLLVRRRRSAA